VLQLFNEDNGCKRASRGNSTRFGDLEGLEIWKAWNRAFRACPTRSILSVLVRFGEANAKEMAT
jgi:hypothetical protein